MIASSSSAQTLLTGLLFLSGSIVIQAFISTLAQSIHSQQSIHEPPFCWRPLHNAKADDASRADSIIKTSELFSLDSIRSTLVRQGTVYVACYDLLSDSKMVNNRRFSWFRRGNNHFCVNRTCSISPQL